MNSLAFVTSKLGNVDRETRSIATELYWAARGEGHEIWFMWGMGGGKEHGSGNALDLMVRNEAAGDYVRNYIWAHRARLRLHHVIWEQHITSTVVRPGVRRKMEDRGDATENHYDHVHVWFFPGVYRPKTIASPKKVAYPGHQHWIDGKDDHHVEQIQKRLKQLGFYKGAIDEKFGPATRSAVIAFQRSRKLTPDGYVGRNTWSALNIYSR